MSETRAGRFTRLVVTPDHDGLRLDQLLAAATGLSRRRARAVASEGLVRRNGDVSRVLSRPVATGDVVDVRLSAEELGVPAEPVLPEVDVLFDDERVAVVDKPAGVLSQPAEHRAPGELAMDERLLLQLASRSGRRPFLRLVHRLDRVTSGTLLFARSQAALAPLARAWREQRAVRVYLAVVEGRPARAVATISDRIERDPGHAWRFRTGAGGRAAHTVVHLLAERPDGTSVVACRLLTGRTHQVRVHLAASGTPVVGDRLYGAVMPGSERPLLHAAVLRLPHPTTGETLEVAAPAPSDLASFLPVGWDPELVIGIARAPDQNTCILDG